MIDIAQTINGSDTHLKLVFNDTIVSNIKETIKRVNGDDVIIINDQKIKNITDLILKYFPIKNIKSDPLIKEIYILYVFSYLFHDVYKLINFTESVFLEKIYYPNIINMLNYYFINANKYFKKIIKDIYNESKSHNYEPLLFCINFYSLNYDTIKNNVINIFLKNVIFDINPFEIENYRSYYYSTFQYIFCLYLEGQSFVDEDIQVSLGQDLSLSSRFNIYKNGLKITQIQAMCCESATLKAIHLNFNKVKHDIISNELQKLYTIVVDKNEITDNKMLLLKFNMEDDYLIDIEKNYPLVYKLLRSLKVQNKSSVYTHYDKVMIRDALKKTLLSKFKMHLEETHAKLLSDAISMKLQQSITEGTYLDPYTLAVLEIRGSKFLKQLSSFINLILENVESTDELDF